MATGRVTIGILVASVLLLGASAAQASDFDHAMEPVLDEYLKIHAALAADENEGVAVAAATMHTLAGKLDPATAGGEHAEHYAQLPANITSACNELREANDIEALREAFKALSMPISMWVTMAKPAHKSVMYCPMAKASWVQHGTQVANPYFGAKMAGCGEKVGGAD